MSLDANHVVIRPGIGWFIPLGVLPFGITILHLSLVFQGRPNWIAATCSLLLFMLLFLWYFSHKVQLTESNLIYRTIFGKKIIRKSAIQKVSFRCKKRNESWFSHAPFWGLWIEGIDDSSKFEFAINAQVYGPARIQKITKLLKEVEVGGNPDPAAPQKITSRSTY